MRFSDQSFAQRQQFGDGLWVFKTVAVKGHPGIGQGLGLFTALGKKAVEIVHD